MWTIQTRMPAKGVRPATEWGSYGLGDCTGLLYASEAEAARVASDYPFHASDWSGREYRAVEVPAGYVPLGLLFTCACAPSEARKLFPVGQAVKVDGREAIASHHDPDVVLGQVITDVYGHWA